MTIVVISALSALQTFKFCLSFANYFETEASLDDLSVVRVLLSPLLGL
jgi:hypothetical protein